MTKPLSPAAQAALDAAEPCVAPSECLGLEAAIAAALRAAVDQVVPDIGHEASVLDEPVTAELQNVREQFLAIAEELAVFRGL